MGDTTTDSTAAEDTGHLSPENRRALEWLREYMGRPLSAEEHERWEERKRFAGDRLAALSGAEAW